MGKDLKLQTLGSTFLTNIQNAAATEGDVRGDGMPWLDINADTGVQTLGRNQDDLPDHEWAVCVKGFEYGFVVWQGRRIVEERVIPVGQGARPMPDKDWATYPGDGPVEIWRFVANSLDEPGLSFRFTAKNASNRMRCRRLLGAIAAQAAVAPAFINPVCRFVPPDSWQWSDGSTIYCLGARIVDWIAEDGRTRQSAATGQIASKNAPWDAAAAE
jgi:hypothetical protein